MVSLEDVGEGSQVLLFGDAQRSAIDSACMALLTVTPPTDTNVLTVTVAGSPERRLDVWRSYNDVLPANAGVIDVSGSLTNAVDDASSEITIEAVSDPGDLTSLGIRASERLDAWANDGHATTVCLDAVTPLLQYADRDAVFQFLHVLLNRIKEVGATAHVHLDPRAHDEQTVATFESLFDATVSVDGNGDTVVRTRDSEFGGSPT